MKTEEFKSDAVGPEIMSYNNHKKSLHDNLKCQLECMKINI